MTGLAPFGFIAFTLEDTAETLTPLEIAEIIESFCRCRVTKLFAWLCLADGPLFLFTALELPSLSTWMRLQEILGAPGACA